MAAWSDFVERVKHPSRRVEIALGRQVHRTARRLQVHLRIVRPRRGHERLHKVKLRYVNSEKITRDNVGSPAGQDGAGILSSRPVSATGASRARSKPCVSRARTIFRSSASVSACSAPSSSSPATCWASPTPIPARWSLRRIPSSTRWRSRRVTAKGRHHASGGLSLSAEEEVRGSPPPRQAQRFGAPRHRYASSTAIIWRSSRNAA